MHPTFNLAIEADYPKLTANLRLLDEHDSQLAFRETNFKTIGVCIAEEVLGEAIFRRLWASEVQRTPRIRLPGASEEEDHLAAALVRERIWAWGGAPAGPSVPS